MSENWISVNDRLPDVGALCRCKVEYWRYGVLHSYGVECGHYLQWNDIANEPTFDIGLNSDEEYVKVTHWQLKEEEWVLEESRE